MYYVIKKDGLYFNDIMGGWDTFSPWGSLFHEDRIDHVWNNYLWPDQKEGAEIYQVDITIQNIRYTPKPIEPVKDEVINDNIGF